MANERQQSAGYGGKGGRVGSGAYGGGAGPGRGPSKGGPSLVGKGPGKAAKGSPRTRNIPSIDVYKSDFVAPSFIASHFQKKDIKEAYQGYKPSPPQGALRGLKNSEVSKGISKSSGYRGGKGHG